MPEAFNSCVKNGGRVRTISGPSQKFGIPGGSYLHVCFKDGKMVRGEVKKKEADSERRAGHPRTDAERRERHKARFGSSKLPPRGTGLNRK